MTGCPGRIAAATLLFAVHPLNVESVAWIVESKDVLSVLLLMLSLLAYERYCRAPGVGRYVGVFLAMLASLLCKATLVTNLRSCFCSTYGHLEGVTFPASAFQAAVMASLVNTALPRCTAWCWKSCRSLRYRWYP